MIFDYVLEKNIFYRAIFFQEVNIFFFKFKIFKSNSISNIAKIHTSANSQYRVYTNASDN